MYTTGSLKHVGIREPCQAPRNSPFPHSHFHAIFFFLFMPHSRARNSKTDIYINLFFEMRLNSFFLCQQSYERLSHTHCKPHVSCSDSVDSSTYFSDWLKLRMPSYKNMLLLTAAACPRPIFYLLLFAILRNIIWNEMWPQNGSSMFTAYFFIYHYSKYSKILYDMRCDHDIVWTQKVYFRCMEGLIAKTRIHTSTNTKLVAIDTSIL